MKDLKLQLYLSCIIFLCSFSNCNSPQIKLSKFEAQLLQELETIPKELPLQSLKVMNFKHFTIDWKSESKWESDCATYDILALSDSTHYHYYIDSCHEIFRWWERTEKATKD